METLVPRHLVVGDTHGAYRALEAALKAAHYHPGLDRLTVLGDTQDGWSQAPEIIEFYRSLPPERLRYVLGNHDMCFLDWVRGKMRKHSLHNHGGAITAQVYQGPHRDKAQAHFEWLSQQPQFIIDPDGTLFVHAGWEPLLPFDHPAQLSQGGYQPGTGHYLWNRSMWEEQCRGANHGRAFRQVFIGHTPTTRTGTGEPLPLAHDNVWNLDTGAGFRNGCVTVMDADTKQYWQSELSHTYYPKERGRE